MLKLASFGPVKTIYLTKTCFSLRFMTAIIIVIKDNSCNGDIIAIMARYLKTYCSTGDQ